MAVSPTRFVLSRAFRSRCRSHTVNNKITVIYRTARKRETFYLSPFRLTAISLNFSRRTPVFFGFIKEDDMISRFALRHTFDRVTSKLKKNIRNDSSSEKNACKTLLLVATLFGLTYDRALRKHIIKLEFFFLVYSSRFTRRVNPLPIIISSV